MAEPALASAPQPDQFAFTRERFEAEWMAQKEISDFSNWLVRELAIARARVVPEAKKEK